MPAVHVFQVQQEVSSRRQKEKKEMAEAVKKFRKGRCFEEIVIHQIKTVVWEWKNEYHGTIFYLPRYIYVICIKFLLSCIFYSLLQDFWSFAYNCRCIILVLILINFQLFVLCCCWSCIFCREEKTFLNWWLLMILFLLQWVETFVLI